MSSLFNRKPKPFQHEEEEEISFLKKKDVKKPLSAKRDADSFLLDDSDDDDFTVKKKTRYDDDVFDLTNDNTDDYREQAKAKIKALTESSKASNVYVIDIESPARIEKEDLAAKKAKELLQQLEMSKKGTAKKSTAKASTTEVFELDYESNYVVPKVAPSIARAATTPSSSSSIHTAEYLSKLTGTSSVQSAPPRPAMTEKPQCKLKTRLNGVHERKWKIAFDESFGKVLSELRTLCFYKNGR